MLRLQGCSGSVALQCAAACCSLASPGVSQLGSLVDLVCQLHAGSAKEAQGSAAVCDNPVLGSLSVAEPLAVTFVSREARTITGL